MKRFVFEKSNKPQGFYPGYPLVQFRPDGFAEVKESFYYVTKKKEIIRVKKGYDSDLESRPTGLPAIFNFILGPTRLTAPAALVHDVLCIRDDVPRKQADEIYFELLIFLKDNNPKSSKKERIRKRLAASLSYWGMRARAWVKWIP